MNCICLLSSTDPFVKYCEEEVTIPLAAAAAATVPLAMGKQTTAAAGWVTTATGTEAAQPVVRDASALDSPPVVDVGEK